MTYPREIIKFVNHREDAEFAYKCIFTNFLDHCKDRDVRVVPEPLSTYDPLEVGEFRGPEFKSTEIWRDFGDGEIWLKGRKYTLEPHHRLYFNTETYEIQKKILVKKWLMNYATLYYDKTN